MNMNYRVLLLLAIVLFALGANAQEQNNKKAGKTKEELTQMQKVERLSWKKKQKVADALFAKGSFYNAIDVYKLSFEDNNENVCAANMLGDSYFLTRDYVSAAEWYLKALELDSTDHQYAAYYLAQSLKRQGKYEEAKAAFEKFRSTEFKKEAEGVTNFKKTIDTEIAGCDLGIRYQNDPVRVRTEHLDRTVNHPLTDFAPWPLANGDLLYSSLISDTLVDITDTSVENSLRYARLYTSAKQGDDLSGNSQYNAPFNQGEYHVGNGSFAPDGKRFVFTKCYETDVITSMRCEIWMSTYNGTEWSEPVVLDNGINGEEFSSTHPQISIDTNGKEVLFFTSTNPEGVGGEDIWVSFSDGKGKFRAPMNLGETINTTGNERTPFFDKNEKILYFSSDALVNIGGFDVFASMQKPTGEYTEPQNLGGPLNSSVDDMYYTLLPDSKTKGYLVSNRAGGYNLKSETCCDDVLSFYYPPTHVFIAGRVTESGPTGNIVEGGVIYVYQKDNDSLVASIPVGADGTYKVKLLGEKEYVIAASSVKHYEKKVNISTFEKEDGEEITENFKLDRRAYYPGMLWGTVYYEFDQSRLRSDARGTLDSLVLFLKDYPRVIMEVGGHTDAIGDSIYNINLSNRRASAVFNYLLKKDIKKTQLVTKGYGEDKPVEPNKTEEGKDNKAGRAVNRRTEFIILDELKDQ